jgi:hypothetical protein
MSLCPPPPRSLKTTLGVAVSLADAVEETLKGLSLGDVDAAAAELARTLAAAIEGEEKSNRTVAELAGKLLSVLESLGATPAARKAMAKGVQQPNDDRDDASGVDELRKRRATRTNRAASVDSTSP